MRPSLLAKLVPAVVGIIAAAALAVWIASSPKTPPVAVREPASQALKSLVVPIDIKGPTAEATKGDGQPATDAPGSWPNFRGPNRDAISPDKVPLVRSFAGGPKRLWTIPLGDGYASPVILNGRVYILDYDEHQKRDLLRCLSLADGKTIWERSYNVKIKPNHGMSRTAPAVTDKYVVTLGPKCHVLCADAVTGEYKWSIDLLLKYNVVKWPDWYAGQCPLIDGDRVILAPGGDALMIAVDIATGEVKWTTPNPRKAEQTHCTIVPVTFKGRKMYVYSSTKGVAGIDAEDGKLLWETDAELVAKDGKPAPDCTYWVPATAGVATPVPCGEDRIFLCSGYGYGAMCIQLVDDAGKIKPKCLYRLDAAVFGSGQQTPIYYDNAIFGVAPNEQMVCLNPADGKVKWSSGSQNRYGIAPYIIADGMLIMLNDRGDLTLAKASASGPFEILAKTAVWDEAQEAWGPMAISSGRLLVREMTKMSCIDLRKQ